MQKQVTAVIDQKTANDEEVRWFYETEGKILLTVLAVGPVSDFKQALNVFIIREAGGETVAEFSLGGIAFANLPDQSHINECWQEIKSALSAKGISIPSKLISLGFSAKYAEYEIPS